MSCQGIWLIINKFEGDANPFDNISVNLCNFKMNKRYIKGNPFLKILTYYQSKKQNKFL